MSQSQKKKESLKMGGESESDKQIQGSFGEAPNTDAIIDKLQDAVQKAKNVEKEIDTIIKKEEKKKERKQRSGCHCW